MKGLGPSSLQAIAIVQEMRRGRSKGIGSHAISLVLALCTMFRNMVQSNKIHHDAVSAESRLASGPTCF
jgi:hypothetical protein